MSESTTLDDFLNPTIEQDTFGMYTDAGAEVAREVARACVRAVDSGKDCVEVAKLLSTLRPVAAAAHDEIYDTEFREAIGHHLERSFAARYRNKLLGRDTANQVFSLLTD